MVTNGLSGLKTRSAAAGSAITGNPWGLVLLLCLGMCANFFDRGNLGVAAPVMSTELGLEKWQTGILLSAFFWTYSVALIGAGWLVDRLETRWIYAAGFLLWTTATLLTGFAGTMVQILAMRMLLGIGESVTYPSNSRILATAFDERRRGLANAVTDLGGRFGPLIGTLCGALIVSKMGWRPLFFITGAIGALWLIPWFIFAPRGILKKSGGTGSVGFRQLLGRREAWGTFGGLFGANYAWYFVLSWLPSYLVHERKLTMGSVAIWGALPYLFMAVSSVAGGYLADRFIARGASPVRIRRAFVSTGLLLAACLMPLCLLPRIEFALAGLFITCLAFGIYVSNLWALTQTLAGPTLAGRWTGLQNAGGNIAGILSPALTGYLVSVHGNFTWAFLAAGIGCLFGSASFRLMIRDRAADGAIPQE